MNGLRMNKPKENSYGKIMESSSKEFIEKFGEWLSSRYIKDKKDVLDLGCGRGYLWKYLKDKGYNAIGADFPQVNAEERLPYKNESFDVVICKSLIEHVRNINGLMSEVRRILRMGGIAIFTTNNTPKDFKGFLEDPTHVTPFSKERLKRLALMNDFKIITLREFRNVPYLWKHSLKAFDFPYFRAREILGVFEK
jgi:2-polyprenyl-3-methyl-5-hydroxy-6-metoxy-1,4-benzoquinol methylase